MLKPEYALYLGREDSIGVTDFAANRHYFIVLEFNHDVPKETARERIDTLKQKILQSTSCTLEIFSVMVDSVFIAEEEIVDVSICAGFVQNDIFYLVTKGKGAVYIKRDNVFEAIVRGDNTASGKIEPNDTYVFASGNFQSLVSEQDIQLALKDQGPKSAVESLTPHIKEKEQQVAIAMFIRFDEEILEEEHDIIDNNKEQQNLIEERNPVSVDSNSSSYADSVKGFFSSAGFFFRKGENRMVIGKKPPKKLTIAILIILLGIFFWSVVLGYQRRAEAEKKRKLEGYRITIEKSFDRAKDLGSSDPEKALGYLTDGEQQIALLESYGKKDVTSEIEKYRTTAEELKKIIEKKEDVQAEEIYDLALINEKSAGSRMFFTEENAIVLDKGRKMVYVINPEKKSHTDYTDSKLANADLVSYYDGTVFVYGSKIGVIKSKDESVFESAISADKELKDVKGTWVYNGNIYVLDSGSDELYKYLVAEKGYSDKTSYFKDGESMDLAEANSFAIDSSVYIGFKSSVIKYIAGVKDSFSANLPKGSYSFDRIFTNKDVDNIFLLDKTQGIVLIVDKNGEFIKQVVSSVLKTADDIGATADSIYALSNNKIFKVKY
jgi:hypothetical protein